MDNREALGCEAGQNIEECNPFDGYASRNVYCKAVPEGRLEANIPGLGTVYMVPTSTYGWFWSQRNLCQKWGKDLIPVEKLRIYRDSTSDSIHGEYLYTQGGGQEAVFACAEGKSCYPWNQAPYNAMWDGDTLTDAKDENGELYSAKFSPIVVALREAFGSRKVFLRTDSGIPPNPPYPSFGLVLDLGNAMVYPMMYAAYAGALCN